MSQLEDRIGAVLADPGELRRLTDMARQIMGNLSGEEGEKAPSPPPERSPSFPGEALSRLLRGMKSEKGAPLLDALGPYLDEGRRARLGRALRLASAARLAAPALRELGGPHGL